MSLMIETNGDGKGHKDLLCVGHHVVEPHSVFDPRWIQEVECQGLCHKVIYHQVDETSLIENNCMNMSL